jgi:protein SCO1
MNASAYAARVRRPRRFLALLAGVALAVAVAGCGADHPAPRPPRLDGAVLPAIPAVDFALRDQDGATVSVRALRGRVVVLTFLYAGCGNTCAIVADQIRGALDDLGRRVPVLAVSVDPARDTPSRARAFLARHDLTRRVRFLLGTRDQLAPVWRTFGVRPRGRRFAPTLQVVLLGPDGRPRVGFPVDQLTPERLVHDVRALAATGGGPGGPAP